MSGLNFNITANNSDFKRKLQEVDAGVSRTTKAIEASGQSVESYFRKMTAGAAALAAGFSARELVSNIVRTRGEMQQLEVAFTTMLQSGEKAASLLADAVEFAAKTPFDLQGVAGGIRQLLAYGTAAEDAIADVEMLGNVSAGLSVPLNDMIYLYGTLRAQGRAFTVDIRQFAGRGVPIYEELAKVLGVTRQELTGLISEGKVGFPEVEQAFRNMTSEGGMFYNLMREQSKTITGQISNLQDSISQMFNSIGQQSEGVITSAISGLSWMVEHYRELARVLGVIVAAYGSYRAAIIAVNAVQAITVSAKNISAFISLARGITTARDAMALLNLTFRANPIGLVVSGITTLVTVLLTLRKRSSDAARAADEARQAIADETAEVNRLAKSLTDTNTSEDERREIMERLRELAPQVVSDIDEENVSLQELNTSLEQYNELRRAEASVQGFASEIGLDKAADSLTEARERMESERTEIVSIWTDISENISRMRFENDELPASLTEFLDRLYDDSLGIEDRVNMIRRYYNTLSTSFKVSHVADENLPFLTEALDGVSFRDYDKALSNLSGAEMRYASDKEQVQQRIRATAQAMSDDLQKQQEIIESLNRAFFPDDFGTSGTGAGTGKGQGILAVDFATQVREAKARIEEARKDLEDLKAGIIPAASKGDAAFSFAAAIREQEKAIKAAKDEYNTLIGYDPKQAQRERDERLKAQQEANDAVLRAREDAEKAEYELAKKGVQDRKELLEMEKRRELEVIQARIDAAKSDDERGSLQRLYNATAGIYDADIRAERDKALKEETEYLNDLLRETATYRQARLDMEEEFARKRRAMYSDESMTEFREGFGQGNRESLDRQEREALDELDMTYAMKSERFREWTEVVADMGIVELRAMLERARAALSEYTSTEGGGYSQEAAEAAAQIQVLTDAIDGFNKKQEESDGDTEKSTANWTELLGVIRDASSTFTELGSAIGGTAGELLSSIGTLSSAVISMATGIQAAATAVSALEKASVILTVISAAIKVVSFFTSAAKENEEANLAASRAAMEYANSLRELADAKRLAASETIFGTDELGQLTTYNSILSERLKELRRIYDEYVRMRYDYYESVYGELFTSGELQASTTTIQSDNRTWLQKIFGSNKNVSAFNLATLFDEAGNIDWDMYESLLAWYDQYSEGIDESHRQMLDDMIAQIDAYKEALDGIREFANSLFGSVASDVADAVLSGTGNLEAEMDEILADINRKVVKAMIENRVIADVFNDDLQEDIIEALKNGDVALANQLFQGGMDRIEGILPDLRELAESVGAIDTGSSSSSTGNTALSSVSQESFDMYSGRVANIQTHVISIDKGVLSMATNSAMAVNLLTDISGDTAHLGGMRQSLQKMSSLLSEIQMKGVKIR